MKSSLGTKSMLFLGLGFVFLILLTVFEARLAGLSLTTEKILSLFLLVTPAVVGALFGVLSLVRKEPRAWIGILGTLLNLLFALFHIFLISFAG
jgi:hypothetical protein